MTLKIAVLKEKHGPRYYSFETKEEFEALALGVLKERYKEGWYESLDGLKRHLKSLTKEVVARYPEFDLYPQPLTVAQQAKKDEMNSIIESISEDRSTDIEFLETLEKLLALPAGESLQANRFDEFRSASDLLRHRGDYEYENFEIITPKKFNER